GKLEETMTTLAKAGEQGGSVADAAALDARFADMQKSLEAKIDATLSSYNSAGSEAVATLQADMATLKAKIGALAEAGLASGEASGPDIEALDKRIAKLEGELPDLTAAVEQGTESARSGTAALAFVNLREAVDAGRPYAAELEAFRALDDKAEL